MSQDTILLRPSRVLIAIFGGGGTAVFGWIFVAALVDGQEFAAVAIWAALLVAMLMAVINYVWFHYVTIDDETLRQVKYFGLIRKSVPLGSVTRIGTRPIVTAFGLIAPVPSVRIQSAQQGVIELGQSYPSGSLRRAVTFLKDRGIPVDAHLLRAVEKARGLGAR